VIPLLRRAFTVDAPLPAAWAHLARIEAWPSWAKHIARVRLVPAGELGARSTGVIRLRVGATSPFAMTVWDPPRRWTWEGPFLWLRIRYDHLFEEVDPNQTRLIWTVEGDGFLVSVFGRLFGAIYARNVDRAIPALMREMAAIPRRG
jgi:polyketide cyclase/dehydrase/lipid transport protein